MTFHTKTYEEYENIQGKPNQPCNHLNSGHNSQVNIIGSNNVLCVLDRFLIYKEVDERLAL